MALDFATRHDRSLAFGVRRERGTVRAGGRFWVTNRVQGACFVGCLAALLLCMASFLPFARGAEAPTEPAVSVSDQLAGKPPDAISLHNIIPGTVRRIVPQAAQRSVLVEIALETSTLLARVTPDAIDRLQLSPGGPVLALIKSTSIEVLHT